MVKKAIQRKRIMKYFIEAVHKIIEEEGLEKVTIRKVSDIAGYNSATLYNYFDDFDHLIFFAYIKYLREYILNLPNCIYNCKTSKEKYIGIWKCFLNYSFLKPKIYQSIFFNKYSGSVNNVIEEYYSIFPEILEEFPKNLIPMLLNLDIHHRNLVILKPCVEDGFVREESLNNINEITILIYHGMLLKFINSEDAKTKNYYIDKTINYIESTMNL